MKLCSHFTLINGYVPSNFRVPNSFSKYNTFLFSFPLPIFTLRNLAFFHFTLVNVLQKSQYFIFETFSVSIKVAKKNLNMFDRGKM